MSNTIGFGKMQPVLRINLTYLTCGEQTSDRNPSCGWRSIARAGAGRAVSAIAGYSLMILGIGMFLGVFDLPGGFGGE